MIDEPKLCKIISDLYLYINLIIVINSTVTYFNFVVCKLLFSILDSERCERMY